MVSIVKAGVENFQILADIGQQTIMQSHGNSAPLADMDIYVRQKFSPETIKKELSDEKNVYHIIYQQNQPAGYSKIIFDAADPNISIQNTTKLERLYLLQQFYGSKLGFQLFQFNVELSKQNHQAGMWLFVWKENHRAVNFYRKAGFEIIGDYDFKISETHSNPNFQMLLKY